MKTETASKARRVLHQLRERMSGASFWASKLKEWLWIFIRTVLIAGISFIVLYPIIIKILIAIKDPIDIYDGSVVLIPKHFTLDNFKLVIQVLNYKDVLLNTVVLSGLVMLLQTFTCGLLDMASLG